MSLEGNKDSTRYVRGPDNPLGLRAQFSRNGEQVSLSRYTALLEHAGWSGILHGRFHKPISVGTKLIVKGWMVKRRRRLSAARAEIRIDGSEATLLTEADAAMCLIWTEGRSSDRFIYQEDSKIVSI